MPSYSYQCLPCQQTFEVFLSFANYQPTQECPNCKHICPRDLCADGQDVQPSIILADSELKTIGHLAERNRDRFSDDHKAALKEKHYAYRKGERPELPKDAKYMNER